MFWRLEKRRSNCWLKPKRTFKRRVRKWRKLPRRRPVKEALDEVARQHATPETYMAEAKKDLEQATAFVRDKDLLTLPPRSNLAVIDTPEFMRGIYAVGGFNPAPPLQPELGAFYWITPIPKTWSERSHRIQTARVQLPTACNI